MAQKGRYSFTQTCSNLYFFFFVNLVLCIPSTLLYVVVPQREALIFYSANPMITVPVSVTFKKIRVIFDQKPNLRTYNFVEVSGYNHGSSQI